MTALHDNFEPASTGCNLPRMRDANSVVGETRHYIEVLYARRINLSFQAESGTRLGPLNLPPVPGDMSSGCPAASKIIF